MIDWDIEELAGYALGLSEEKREKMINDSETDEKLYNRYGIDFESYCRIVKDLLPFTPIITTAIREVKCNAFIDGHNIIVKKEIAIYVNPVIQNGRKKLMIYGMVIKK